MKQLRHPNLAVLLEVIDDPREDRIYIGEYTVLLCPCQKHLFPVKLTVSQ